MQHNHDIRWGLLLEGRVIFTFLFWQTQAAIQHAVCVCLRYNAQFLAAFLFFMLLLGKRYCENGYYPSSLQRSFAIAILWKAHIRLIKVFLLHHLCLVLNRDKMHDPGNALWNVRMRIYFDANVMREDRLTSEAFSLNEAYFFSGVHDLGLLGRNLPKFHTELILGCRNLLWHSQLQKIMNPHLFFFTHSPFVFFSSCRACFAF